MVNKLLKGLEKESNYKSTENLALTHASSLSGLLDFFGLGGALRTRSNNDIISLFSRAFAEDPLLAMKCLFYFRDIRGGQGERKTFRTILNYLGTTHTAIIEKNLLNIPFFGRWDDLYSLVGTESEIMAFRAMKEQFIQDIESETPSLLGKWLKSINTSSKKSRELGRKTLKAFGIESEKLYRKALSDLRRKIKIVERKMCANQWKSIDYERVPSNASLLYRKAFKKHDPEGYQAYLDAVEKGEKEIKTKTLYPYDIIRAVDREGYNRTLDLQWNNLPNYVQEGEYSIVVCDTSGSMVGGRRQPEPIHVSVSLAMYFAERNKGPFENSFITFSAQPNLQKIVGGNIYEKYRNLCRAHWEMNTNLIAVFELILKTALKYNITPEEMIKKIYIISDMEFDRACRRNDKTNFQFIREMYDKTPYEMPGLVFWNVDARQDQSPITVDDRGVFLVSGCSPSIFESLMRSEAIGPVDLMLEVLNKERYDRVVI